eukprot:11764042-Heterocapsa_arctica.AAC.1
MRETERTFSFRTSFTTPKRNVTLLAATGKVITLAFRRRLRRFSASCPKHESAPRAPSPGT